MSGAELRAYGLGALLFVLLGGGIGIGLHYFVDGAGGKAAAASVAALAKQDAPTSPLSCPPPQVEGPVPTVPTGAGLSEVQQPPRSKPHPCAKGEACGKHQHQPRR